jgi:hypothetical protein
VSISRRISSIAGHAILCAQKVRAAAAGIVSFYLTITIAERVEVNVDLVRYANRMIRVLPVSIIVMADCMLKMTDLIVE